MEEVERIEWMRQRREFEESLPPIDDESRVEERNEKMKKLEMMDWNHREKEVDKFVSFSLFFTFEDESLFFYSPFIHLIHFFQIITYKDNTDLDCFLLSITSNKEQQIEPNY